MTRERLKSPRARLFVALDLPDDIRVGLSAWVDAELVDPALRPVAPQALHITLCFLGYHPEKRIPELEALLAELEPRPVPMRFNPEPVAKPPRTPRLFALDAESPAAVELQDELSARLVAARLYEPEKRPFWCHVTVARVRRERGERRPRRVERRPGELPADLVRTFDSVRLSLYRSNLRPAGAEYVSLASVNLPTTAM